MRPRPRNMLFMPLNKLNKSPKNVRKIPHVKAPQNLGNHLSQNRRLTISSERIRLSETAPYIHLSVQRRASTDWPAPTCASPSKVVRKRGRWPRWHPQPKEISMAPARPYWKGYLKLSLVSCPIALYTGTSVDRAGLVPPDQQEDRQPPAPAAGRRGHPRAGRGRR